ncbi:MAG: hypothetical protein Kow0058_18650 [Roseovarius sp.]
MANTTANIRISVPRQGLGTRLLAALGRAIEAHGRVASRRAAIEKLQACSDAELAALGLRREDIIRHVFRDLFYI